MAHWRADAIKRAARKEAWFGDDEHPTYNPFGRLVRPGRPRRTPDEETGDGGRLSHVQSENDAGPTPIETRRREEARPGSSGVHKHHTFPSGPTGDLPADNRSNEKERHTSDDITSSDTAASQGGTEKGLVNGRPPREAPESETYGSVGTANGQGPRRRKLRKFLPWKKSEHDAQELERTETSQSKRKKYPPISVTSQFKAVFGSWINILLIMVPVGFALNYSHQNGIAIFVVNFIAIIPLAAMLSYATEELAMYIGETLGGLLNATFGNAVELIVGIIALVQKKVLIVQTSLIGSMLSNLLLVMGMCFFFGGIRRDSQYFNLTVAQTAASLLALAVGALIIPTAFVQFAEVDSGATPASRGTAVMLLVVYGCYLFFQLSTHADIYNEPSQKSPKRPNGKKEAGEALHGLATIGAGTGAAAAGGHINQTNLVQEQDEEEETPQLTIMGALLTLGGSTVLVAFCAEFMVSGINALTSTGNVSDEFVGLILLPIVGNAAEHATAVTVAIKDKMDLAIGVAVGSSLQIALLVLPIMVMLNWWGVGSPADLSLSFDGFQVSVLFIAVIVVNYVIQDGKSHWLEGVMLQITYLIIAVSAWFYPANGEVAG